MGIVRRTLTWGMFVFTAGILISVSPVSAAERDQDTLKLETVTVYPGETFIIPIWITNSMRLGGYTVRFTYDPTLIEPVTVGAGSSVLGAVRLRGDFTIFDFEVVEPGVIAGVTAIISDYGMEIGRGFAVELPFRAISTTVEGQSGALTFIPHPDSPYSSNWFSDYTGLVMYEPTKIDGNVIIGCDCTEIGDVDTNGAVGPTDVVVMTNFVYRAFLTEPTKRGSCPNSTGDFDCDGMINPIDVVMFVNYVYRGYQTGPCDPCVE